MAQGSSPSAITNLTEVSTANGSLELELLVRRTACVLFEDGVRFGPKGILPFIKVFLQMGQAEGRRLQVGWLGLHLTTGPPAGAPPLLL